MTSLTGRFVAKLTFTLKKYSKSIGFTQNNVGYIVQVMMHIGDIGNYAIVSLFTARGVRLIKLSKCWNTVVFSGFITDEKCGLRGYLGVN